MEILLIILSSIIGLAFLVWLGLQIKPAPFKPFSQDREDFVTSIPLPDGLPSPVERFYYEIYGKDIPHITSAVISGRAWLKPFGGIRLPARFRFYHEAGQNYRHYIDVTFFGLPIMKVDERYLDGRGRMALPFGIIENEPNIDQGANLALWTESFWLPALLLTDPRVSWQALDDQTAILTVPYKETQEKIIVRFDSQSGMVKTLEAMRFKQAQDATKTLWFNDALHWSQLDGHNAMVEASVTWHDDRIPWAIFTVEELLYNLDVSDALRAKGP